MSDRAIKKEFVAIWMPEKVHAQTHRMPYRQAAFFDHTRSGEDQISVALIPDIPFKDLLVFSGRRTKITIELLP